MNSTDLLRLLLETTLAGSAAVLLVLALRVPVRRWLGASAAYLLWLAVPVYLFWMQQRVYGGNPILTLLRYGFIGFIYFFLVTFVVMYAVLAGVSA